MSDGPDRAAIRRLLGLVAQHLEDFLEGDEMALEALGPAIEETGLTGDEMQTAVLAIRSLAGAPMEVAQVAVDDPPGEATQRVLSAEERDSLSPEAWGYLLDLRRRRLLDAAQFERVLDRLATSGVRPVGLEMAREVAVRVAMRGADLGEERAAESELAH